MVKNNYSFTSESVCAGHPDKICDQISDAIVDAVLRQDPFGRVAVETVAARNHLFLVGEVTTTARVKYKEIAKEQIKRLGYTDPTLQFTPDSQIKLVIHTQSPEIAQGVDQEGAGDQGIFFGFACRDNNQSMPMPITIAHAITQRIDEVREKQIVPYLRPDGKSQVTIRYEKGKPVEVEKVIIAVPHTPDVSLSTVKEDMFTYVVKPILSQFSFKISRKNLVVNRTGVWHMSGPATDSGLTGRKIVVDSYGGYARVGGGAFSGKDPTKVDRSAAYAARFLAKNIVAHKLADKAEVSLAYFIGAKKPLMEEVETFGTSRKSDKVLKDFMNELLDTSVKGILEGLQLRRPLYLPTAAYGHFGREIFPWEKIVD